MLQRVMLDGIELPRLYIAENQADIKLAMDKGIPFIRWTKGQDALIRMLLRPLLEQMFPHIMWNKVLGNKRRFRTEVEIYERADEEFEGTLATEAELEGEEWVPRDSLVEDDEPLFVDEDGNLTELSCSTTGQRTFLTGGHEMPTIHKLDIETYVGDMSSYVDLEILQRLRLMPAFIGDILECVKLNVGSGMYWNEGYNKRLGLPVGRYNSSPQLPNLIILDVSGSIPRGISATMISLVDTLRTQLSADLIITSSNSRFYPMGSKLPDPQTIRDKFGYGNESHDFFGILNKEIRGRHYGHVFSFGDYDTPDYRYFHADVSMSLMGTTVEHVHHYHTGLYNWRREEGLKTGYAKWCHMLAKKPIESYDTDWCKVIRK